MLHEFHKLKYICPDKSWGKKDTAAASKAETEEVDGEQPSAPKKWKGTKAKDKYKGGLVFEPKRGLWDKYVLVMDFNSLYPSIIQEYNIDFTTVAKVEDEVRSVCTVYLCVTGSDEVLVCRRRIFLKCLLRTFLRESSRG